MYVHELLFFQMKLIIMRTYIDKNKEISDFKQSDLL